MLAQQKIAVAQMDGVRLDGTKRITTAVFAAALGIFFVYSTAFSHSTTLHNAAHDTRHAARQGRQGIGHAAKCRAVAVTHPPDNPCQTAHQARPISSRIARAFPTSNTRRW